MMCAVVATSWMCNLQSVIAATDLGKRPLKDYEQHEDSGEIQRLDLPNEVPDMCQPQCSIGHMET